MPTDLTRFEIVLPTVDVGSPRDQAIQTFLSNMETLCDLVMYTAYIFPMTGGIIQQNILYGLITTTQRANALSFLTTLNNSLGTTVLCTVNTVTKEP